MVSGFFCLHAWNKVRYWHMLERFSFAILVLKTAVANQWLNNTTRDVGDSKHRYAGLDFILPIEISHCQGNRSDANLRPSLLKQTIHAALYYAMWETRFFIIRPTDKTVLPCTHAQRWLVGEKIRITGACWTEAWFRPSLALCKNNNNKTVSAAPPCRTPSLQLFAGWQTCWTWLKFCRNTNQPRAVFIAIATVYL